MRVTKTNNTAIRQIYFDKNRRHVIIDPGETKSYWSDDSYDSFAELIMRSEDVNGDSSLVYTGYAKPGTVDGDRGWIVRKIVVAGVLTTTTWAGGDERFMQWKWDDRATLVYS